MPEVFDIAIIGGGINGCGCAADGALRGLSVVLFEQDDLASKTSSNSTKLIHGGLRYLEYYEFSLVKKALAERQLLLKLAPHLVHPQSFVLPYQKYMRPFWFLRLGLFIYDHLSRKNRLPKCKTIKRDLNRTYFSCLKDKFKRGFLFYDASTDDARLTITNAMQAKKYGAQINSRSRVIKTEIVNNLWQLTVQPKNGTSYLITARAVINASGPWVDEIAQLTQISAPKMTLVKGSHLVVPALYSGTHAFFLQHQDKRIIFVIPYHGFSLIGTTDVPFTDSLDTIAIDEQEIEYLIDSVNSYFKTKIAKPDIITTWSGVRPLLAESGKELRALSRDYSYRLLTKPAPIITIFGGKITTYRQLAEEVINKLAVIFPQMSPSLTHTTPLPGASLNEMNFEQYTSYAKKKYSWVDPELLNRYLLTYGTNTDIFLAPCKDEQSLGKKFGDFLYQVEVDYLIAYEWAVNSDDILSRRTKLGLTMSKTDVKQLEFYLNGL